MDVNVTNCVASFIAGFTFTMGGVQLYYYLNSMRVDKLIPVGGGCNHQQFSKLNPTNITCVNDEFSCGSRQDPNYNIIYPDLLEIIKATGMGVVEISAGKGLNKLFLEKHGVNVEAYDIFPTWSDDPALVDQLISLIVPDSHIEKKEPYVKQGANGSFKLDPNKVRMEIPSFEPKKSIEKKRELFVKRGTNGSFEPDSNKILMAMSSIEPEKAIEQYKGNMIILGGTGNWVTLRKCDLITDSSNATKTTITEMIPSNYESGKHHSQIELKMSPSVSWMRDNGWTLENTLFNQDGGWVDTFHIHQIWIRKFE